MIKGQHEQGAELWERKCVDCGNILTQQDIERPQRKGRPYFSECCTSCAATRQKIWKAERNKNFYNRVKADDDSFIRHRKRLQRNSRKRLFGLSDEEYQALFNTQQGLCACCGKPETMIDARSGFLKDLAVDHNHKTDKVRSLLCYGCNVAFGLLEEDPERIALLLEYAKKHKREERNEELL